MTKIEKVLAISGGTLVAMFVLSFLAIPVVFVLHLIKLLWSY